MISTPHYRVVSKVLHCAPVWEYDEHRGRRVESVPKRTGQHGRITRTATGNGRGAATPQSHGRGLPAALVALMNPQFTAARERAMSERTGSEPVTTYRYHEMMTKKLLEGLRHG